MHHLAAFFEDADYADVLSNVAAVQDETITTSGDDVRVPPELPFIIGAAGLSNADTQFRRAQIASPSLRSLANLDIEPIINAIVFGSPPEVLFHPQRPIPVQPDESLNFLMQTDEAAGNANHYGLIWLADGPQQPVAGQMFSIRATAAVTLSAGVWVNGNLTFSQTLPAGRYQIIGMRARGTNLVAARLAFPGGMWRPGVPAVNAIGDRDAQTFRFGHSGVFGEFTHTRPPTVDCLGVTDSTQTFTFDLVKVG